jgi:hypothetical protein
MKNVLLENKGKVHMKPEGTSYTKCGILLPIGSFTVTNHEITCKNCMKSHIATVAKYGRDLE